MNISHFRFLLFNLEICRELITPYQNNAFRFVLNSGFPRPQATAVILFVHGMMPLSPVLPT